MTTAAPSLDQIAAIYNSPAYWHGGLNGNGYTREGYRDFPANDARVKVILAKRPMKVLDVGCAMGYLVRRLRAAQVDAWGADCSAFAIASAPDDVRPYLAHAWAHQLPYEDKSIDLLVSTGMLEHLPPDLVRTTLAEFARVARRGLLSISLPHEPGVTKDEHPSLLPLREWRHLVPENFEVVGDSLEAWAAFTGDSYSLVGPAILPLGVRRYGGVERLVAHFAKGLRGRGYRIRVVGSQGSTLPHGVELFESGPPQQDFSEPGLRGAVAASITGVQTRAVIDFSHSHPSRVYPTLPQMHLIWHDPKMMQTDLPAANLVALSTWQAERLGARQALVLDPICFDEDFYHLPTPSESAIPDEGPRDRESAKRAEELPSFHESTISREGRILFIGKLHPTKGALEAIRICSMAGLPLDIIGPVTPGDPPEYAQAVISCCDGDEIRYLGEVDEERKREAIWGASCLLYPVSYPPGAGESHSHKMVEVMACGTPCVAYSQGAMKEIIEEGVTGYLAKNAREAVAMLGEAAKLDRAKVTAAAKRRWSIPATMERWLPVMDLVARGERW